MFAVRATFHTTTQATPSQLVFGRDAILNVQFEANWNFIRMRKQRIIQKNNQKENSKRTPHVYQIGDKVLYRQDQRNKFGMNPWEGPYDILQVYDNGTVAFKRGAVIDKVNLRLIKPFKD